MAREWPVDVQALTPAACGAVVWAGSSGPRVTIIAKASFSLRPGAVVERVDAWPLVKKEQHRDGSPWTSIVAADDLAPRIPGAGVVVTGHAHAVGPPVTAHAVRLAVSRGKVLIDKTLHVFGDRDAAEPGRPKPFQHMPLDYEHTYGGAGFRDNPLGRGAAPGSPLPNVVAPSDPRRPASFAPLARIWQRRKGLLDAGQRSKLAAAVPELGDDFPFAYFHAAPEDQRLEALVGDEWILLDGMHPAAPRVETRLPGARAVARVFGLGREGSVEVALRLDSLIIDADRQQLSLVWRSAVELGATLPAHVKALVAVELPGATPTAWPSEVAIAPVDGGAAPAPSEDFGETRAITVEEAARVAGRAPTPFVAPSGVAAPKEDPFAGTVMLSPDGPASVSLPFAPSATPSGPRQPAQALPGAPWGPPASSVAPAPPGDRTLDPSEVAAMRREQVPVPSASAFEPPPVAGSAGGPSMPEAVPASRFFHSAERREGGGAPPPPPDAPRPPARASEVARAYTDSSFVVATLSWQIQPPADALVIVVKGTFSLVPDAPAVIAEAAALPIGDIHVDDDPMKSLVAASDFAVLKPKADVLLHAQAHAPGGAARAMQVTFRFGGGDKRFERTLHVFGDRVWGKSVITTAPTDPAEFTTIPITWERAFGGPAYDKNPAGVGHRAAAGPDGVARLPNVEVTATRVVSPSDAPPPACFGPVPPLWKERWSKLGTYDMSWFKTRWPYWPKDFDWTFYQAAPPEQQLPYLVGDEPFELVGVNAGRPSLKGSLPGLKARAFVQRTPEAGGRFIEVPLVLDTATFDAEARLLDLVWRGHLEVSDDDAPEVQHVFVLADPIAGPVTTLDEARARYFAVATPKPAAVEAPAPKPPPPANDELRAAEAEREEALEDVPPLDQPPEPPPSLDEIAASMKRRGESDDDIADLLALLQPEPPEAEAPAEATARERAVALLAANAPFDGLIFDGADLSDLDFSGRSMVGASLVATNLARARLASASLVGARLERADLSRAVLDGADLREADLKGVTVEEASFTRANAAGAKLEGAHGERAVFTELAGAGADFREADLPRARFDGADLVGARFFSARVREARFSNAKMDEIRFYDAVAEGASLDGIHAQNGRFERATFTRASFRGASLEGAVFERCKLEQASFVGANATGASFLRAAGANAAFTGATLVEARLTRARLGGASFLGANLQSASLEKSDLTRADFRKANLHSAGLWKAKIDGADFADAILTKSTLVMRRPP